jgi:hypothetical protein
LRLKARRVVSYSAYQVVLDNASAKIAFVTRNAALNMFCILSFIGEMLDLLVPLYKYESCFGDKHRHTDCYKITQIENCKKTLKA